MVTGELLYAGPVATGLDRNELCRELLRDICSEVGRVCSGGGPVCCKLMFLLCGDPSDSYGFKIVGGAVHTLCVGKIVFISGFRYRFALLDVRSGGGAYFRRR